MARQRRRSNPPPNSLAVHNDPAQGSANLTFTHTQLTYSGILPPPEMLSRYSEIVSDAPERIIQMAEKQSAHRQNLESWAVKGDMVRSFLGVLCAFAIVIATLYVAKELIEAGNTTGGYIFGGLGLASLVATFIYGTRSRREERVRRDMANRQLTRR